MKTLRILAAALATALSLAASLRADYAIGINDHILYRTTAEQDVAFARYDDSGTRFVRVNVDWHALEYADDSYSPARVAALDYFFQGCAARGIRVLACVAYAPTWANGGNSGGGWPPVDNVKYADFCEWVLRRYAPYASASGVRTLEAIELWNEPDLCDLFFKGYSRNAPAAATRYANMVKVAGARLQSVRASIGASGVLIGAPVIANPHDAAYAAAGAQSWMDAFYAVTGVTACYDFFAWHTYWEHCGTTGWLPPELPPCWYPANQRQAVLGRLIATNDLIWSKITAAGDHLKPNWCTEIGGASRSSTANHSIKLLSFAEQQSHLADAASVLVAGSVTKLARIYCYEIFDEPGNVAEQQVYGLVSLNTSNPVAYSGNISLAGATLANKPAYYTYKALTKTNVVDSLTLLFDNFDDGNSDGWTATPGTWAVSAQQYVSPHTAATAVAYTGDSTWSDYRVSCKIKFANAWKLAGLLAAYNGTGGYYLRVQVDEAMRSHYLTLFRNGVQVATTSIQDTYDFSTFRKLSLSIRTEGTGVRVKGFVDGNEHINHLDTTNTYQQGKAGVRSDPWSGTVTVDDFEVVLE
jgi:hypothetical protein